MIHKRAYCIVMHAAIFSGDLTANLLQFARIGRYLLQCVTLYVRAVLLRDRNQTCTGHRQENQ